MSLSSPSESLMWNKDANQLALSLDDQAINEKYTRGEGRIVTESNREKLPGFVQALQNPNYINLHPFYQRRSRWKVERQSLLIESFIMNVPVPPIFLYERDYNSYEVMDGQQRITAIRDFYNNKFALIGLEQWPELNGRYYHNLPAKIKTGIDRRSISSIVLLKESAPDDEEAIFLRQLVFQRLNTGGIRLERQEIRNAIYQGSFNEFLVKLSRLDLVRLVWGLPRYVENENDNPELIDNSLFSKMGDVELVLRFFALRHDEHYRGGLQSFLDLYMARSIKFKQEDYKFLEEIFTSTLNLAYQIFGDKLFKPFEPGKDDWAKSPLKGFYDAIMVSLSRYLDKKDELIKKKDIIVEKTKEMFRHEPVGTFTGRGSTKADVQNRINLLQKVFTDALV